MRPTHKKKWGNSVVFFNIKSWRCHYCGNTIKDDVPFGIVKLLGEAGPEIYCSELCLKVQIIKADARRSVS